MYQIYEVYQVYQVFKVYPVNQVYQVYQVEEVPLKKKCHRQRWNCKLFRYIWIFDLFVNVLIKVHVH